MSQIIKKLAAVAFAIVLAGSLSGGSVLALECYNASRSAKGNEMAANSQVHLTPGFILVAYCGLTEDEAATVLETLSGEGYQVDILIHGRTFMAGGLQRNGDRQGVLHNGKGIDHLSHDFFERLVELAPGCDEEAPE